jgi:hypothetical protein
MVEREKTISFLLKNGTEAVFEQRTHLRLKIPYNSSITGSMILNCRTSKRP